MSAQDDETALRGFEAMSAIVHERNKLRAREARRESNLSLLRERCRQVESRLAAEEHKANHYMRYSTAVNTRLKNIMLIIQETLAEAEHAMFVKPDDVPTPAALPELSLADESTVAALVKQLPVYDRDEPSDPLPFGAKRKKP